MAEFIESEGEESDMISWYDYYVWLVDMITTYGIAKKNTPAAVHLYAEWFPEHIRPNSIYWEYWDVANV